MWLFGSCWALALMVPAYIAIIPWFYYAAASIGLPSNADSTILPIVGLVFVGLLLTPIFLGITMVCLWRSTGRGGVFAWNSARPLLSVTITLILGGAALSCLLLGLSDFFRQMSWYEYLWTPLPILFAGWLVALRAAALSPKKTAVL
jgi:hypothetical protein